MAGIEIIAQFGKCAARVDAKMLSIETEQRKADIRLREIDLEILKLKQSLGR